MGKPTILIIAGHYLPSTKAGGAMRAIINLIDYLGDEFNFRVLTTDRDLGDTQPYPHIPTGVWLPMSKALVHYLSPQEQRWGKLREIICQTPHDLRCHNSFFFALNVKVYMLDTLRQLPPAPTILGPQGEFSPGALAQKWLKKKLYLTFGRWQYRRVIWHAAGALESEDIRRMMGANAQVIFASNLPTLIPTTTYPQPEKLAGSLRVVFLSRLARMKNVDFVLRTLAQVTCPLHLDIYGPIEDAVYWAECQSLMAQLPPHIQVKYCGAVAPDQTLEVFARYHVFFFPTLGENFGYVVLESLLAGCPVLISDQTPWQDLTEKDCGWVFPLANPASFAQTLEKVAALDQNAWDRLGQAAKDYAQHYLAASTQPQLEAHRHLIKVALQEVLHKA
jgi:glycosyltransferase involved in cell wall biosynthesis